MPAMWSTAPAATGSRNEIHDDTSDSVDDAPADPSRLGATLLATTVTRNALVSDRAMPVRARSHRVARRNLTSCAFIRQPYAGELPWTGAAVK